MNFERGDTDKLNIFRQELQRHRLVLLPPDINYSFPLFAVEESNGKPAIRYGLSAIKGVGDAAMASVIATREKGGLYKDLFDFAERIDPRVINRKQLENLIAAGAFDNFNKNRAQLQGAIDNLLKHSHQANHERGSGQSNMFATTEKEVRPPLPPVKAWDDLTRLQHEFQAFGFYLSSHPLDNFRVVLNRLGVVEANDVAKLQRALGPNRFKLAGVVVSKQERTSKQGNRFAFIQLSDASGAFEVTVFSELLASKRDILEAGQTLLLEVDAQATQNASGGSAPDGGALRFIARSIEKLSSVTERAALGLVIRLYESSALEALQQQLSLASPGKGKIVLQLVLDQEEEADVELPGGWQLTEKFKSNLRQLGEGLEVGEF